MSHHTGIGRYIRGLVSAFGYKNAWKYVFLGNHELKDFPHVEYVRFNAPIYSLQEQLTLPFAANRCNALHIPHYNVPVFWNKKLIVTIHDLIHLEFSKDLNPFAVTYAKTLLPIAVRKADAIIAVSEKTKTDLVTKLKVPPKKISVIYHGIDPVFLSDGGRTVPEKKDAPYFIYVGLIKSHKNLGVLLKAFVNLRKKTGMGNLRLRIIGTPDRKQRLVRQWLNTISAEPNITIETGLHDEALKSVYSNALALIFPSLYEGFGFPLLEAMACKIPIIAARATSIPEVLGEYSGLYFDPQSESDLEHQMNKILSDNVLKDRLIREGSERLKLFNWNRAAKQTEEIYESVLST